MAEKITKRVVDGYNATGKLKYIWDTEVKGFGLLITAAGSKSFILNYRNKDKRSRRKTIGKYGHLTVEQARDTAKELCYRISKGEDPVQQEELLRQQPLFKEVAQKFLDEHSAIRLRAASHRSNIQYINTMLLPFFGKMKIRSIERRDVQDFISKNKHRPIGCNRSLGTLSSILSKAELWDYRDYNTNPCFRLERYPDNYRERFLTEAEFAALELAMQDAERKLTISPYAIAVFRIMMHTGCRPGEARLLKWEYIDFENMTIRLPKEATKEKRPKTLFITPFLEQVLKNIKPMLGNPYVIVSKRCTGQAYTGIKKPWDHIKKAAGITTELHMHDLRHSHASVANSLGYSLPMIGALLGHTQAQTTLRYAHLASNHLRKAAEEISAKIASSTMKAPNPAHLIGQAQLYIVK